MKESRRERRERSAGLGELLEDVVAAEVVEEDEGAVGGLEEGAADELVEEGVCLRGGEARGAAPEEGDGAARDADVLGEDGEVDEALAGGGGQLDDAALHQPHRALVRVFADGAQVGAQRRQQRVAQVPAVPQQRPRQLDQERAAGAQRCDARQ